jgi:hypothetical protein
VCALLASAAFAQGTAVITGIVVDAATNAPVPDVAVTAVSPALQGEATALTDATGTYRITQLPPGVFTLRLEHESYKPYARTDVNVRTDRTVRVNVQLLPDALQGDTVVVVAKPATVDVGTANTGLSVGKDFIQNVPFVLPNANGVRSFESLASAAPQVIDDRFGYGFSGAQSPENLYLVDGVSVGDPALGRNGTQFPVEFVEEANVVTGGYQAEYGRSTGGVLNVVTKSGSNEFHGMVWGNWTPGVLTGNQQLIDSVAQSPLEQKKLLNTVDFGAQIGGPILKDRLWFFVGLAPSFNSNQTSRSLRAFVADEVTGADTTPIPGSTQVREETSRAFSYIAKLTLLLNADNNIALSVVGAPSSQSVPFSFNSLRRAENGWRGGTIDTRDSNTVSLRYQGKFFDKHLLVDASAGWFHLSRSNLPDDGSSFSDITANNGTAASTASVIYRRTTPHPITKFESLTAEGAALCTDPATGMPSGDLCPATGNGGATYTIGGMGLLQAAALDRIQARASGTIFFQALGHHAVKAGIDVEHLRYDITTGYSGGLVLRESTSGATFSDYRQYGVITGPDQATRLPFQHSTPTSNGIGAFVQDSWQIMDLVTLNAGVRYENQQLFGGDGALGLTLNNMLSPRIGVVYDFTQQGRSKLFANYARYYEAVPISIANRSLTGENQFQFVHNRAGCDPVAAISQATAECQDPSNTRAINAANGGDYDPSGSVLQTGAGRTPVDANLKPQSSDEIVLGGEYEVIHDGRAGVTYTHRYMNSVIEDLSVDEGSTYFIGNPGEGLASAFPRATRNYHAVTGYFTKAFDEGWMAQVSYTYSTLTGNYNGLFRPETGQIDPNNNADFDLVSLLANRTGPLDADRSHSIKAYAAKEFQVTQSFSLLAGLTYEGRSGAPINYFGSHPIYGRDEVFVLPRGAGGRLPWRHTINAKLAARYRVSKDNVIEFSADVFNMLNFQAVTAVDQTLTTSDVLPYVATNTKDPQSEACLAGSSLPQCAGGQTPIQAVDGDGNTYNLTREELNPNFKRPREYQQPISVRFGLKFIF